jgi:hypothetical protein
VRGLQEISPGTIAHRGYHALGYPQARAWARHADISAHDKGVDGKMIGAHSLAADIAVKLDRIEGLLEEILSELRGECKHRFTFTKDGGCFCAQCSKFLGLVR